jgi:hypothetical protein
MSFEGELADLYCMDRFLKTGTGQLCLEVLGLLRLFDLVALPSFGRRVGHYVLKIHQLVEWLLWISAFHDGFESFSLGTCRCSFSYPNSV